ncbi:hypothetical protein AB0K35_00755 [Micromonospora sp. NPDC053740]|uniref:hypothetical protein n=1 Tax=Micromonospora sp. NPDC053740 TaxID=3155173 RepID=UPI003434DF74
MSIRRQNREPAAGRGPDQHGTGQRGPDQHGTGQRGPDQHGTGQRGTGQWLAGDYAITVVTIGTSTTGAACGTAAFRPE